MDRRRVVTRNGAVLALLTGGCLALAAAASGTVPTGNLLQNPDAEAGACANATSPAVPVPGWNTTYTGSSSGFTVLCYSAGLSQDASSGAAINGGNGYFMGGTDTPTQASQTVDVSSAAGEIDSGSVAATLAGDLGGFSSQDDNMIVTATFRNAAGGTVGTPLKIGPVTAAGRGGTSEMLARTMTGTVPAGTRSILVVLTSTRVQGSDNDGAADNLSLTLGTVTPKPPISHTKITKVRVNSKQHTITYAFKGKGHVTGFRCALLRGRQTRPRFTRCRSPKVYSHLKPGRYTFEVTAIQSSGSGGDRPSETVTFLR